MIVRIAQRGKSFLGAMKYYMHDKDSDTNERVEWAYTLNLPTEDAEQGLKWMAWTAQNADKLKIAAGIPLTGRKSTAGCVYSFSLSWHPSENPDRETMQQAAIDALGLLKLDEHEAVIIAHNDTAHPHVHVLCNLHHPETGRMAAPSYDRITLSNWAEKLERRNGKILCKQRVSNNMKRAFNVKPGRQLGMVKHREHKSIQTTDIERLYHACDGGKAFKSALAQIGFTLCYGNRRGYVLVDGEGKIHSLSRQLKGQRAKDIRQKLKNVGHLPDAEIIKSTSTHHVTAPTGETKSDVDIYNVR